MNPDVKAKWLAALRSGKYKQARSSLHVVRSEFDEEVGYCCLGVLCEVAVSEGVPLRRYRKTVHANAIDDGLIEVESFDGSSAFPPTKVVDWAGLPEGNPEVLFDGEPDTLSGFNDDHKFTFSQIADLIEEQL